MINKEQNCNFAKPMLPAVYWLGITIKFINKMQKVIITGYTVKEEGVILETNIFARLKPNRMPSKETFVSWDKLGKLLFEDYTDEVEVAERNKLRSR